MKKILIFTLILTCVMLNAFTASARGISPWAQAETDADIVSWIENNVKDKDFTDNISRGDAAKILLYAYLKENISFEIIQTNPFADVSDPVILASAALGLVDSEGDMFFPDEGVTRMEAAQYIYNFYASVYGVSPDEQEEFEGAAYNAEYSDISVTPENRLVVGFAHSEGIIRGIGGAFSPDRPCTVEEFALMVSRGLN